MLLQSTFAEGLVAGLVLHARVQGRIVHTYRRAAGRVCLVVGPLAPILAGLKRGREGGGALRTWRQGRALPATESGGPRGDPPSSSACAPEDRARRLEAAPERQGRPPGRQAGRLASRRGRERSAGLSPASKHATAAAAAVPSPPWRREGGREGREENSHAAVAGPTPTHAGRRVGPSGPAVVARMRTRSRRRRRRRGGPGQARPRRRGLKAGGSRRRGGGGRRETPSPPCKDWGGGGQREGSSIPPTSRRQGAAASERARKRRRASFLGGAAAGDGTPSFAPPRLHCAGPAVGGGSCPLPPARCRLLLDNYCSPGSIDRASSSQSLGRFHKYAPCARIHS